MESRRRKEEEERRKQEESDKKLAVSVDGLKEYLPVSHLETNCSLHSEYELVIMLSNIFQTV